jgi:CheY-like chemotaxis protein
MAKAHILVVDDNLTNLKLATDLLIWAGYEVAQAADAERALEAIGRQRPALILMDVGLPGMDGLTLTRQLKSDPATRGIWIVALTAFAMKGDERKALDAGCDGYIAKPINTREFAGRIAGFLADSGW